jgi:Zn-dependent metalloprotease
MAARHHGALIALTATLALAGCGSAPAAPRESATPLGSTTPREGATPPVKAAPPAAPKIAPTAAIGAAKSEIRRNGKAVKSAPGEKYQAVDAVVDDGGEQHVRFQRTHDGLPVLGGDFVVHSTADGSFRSATVAQDQAIDIPATTKISRAEAIETAGLTGKPQARKVVDALDGRPALAWEVTGHAKVVIVDATTGKVRLAYDTVHTAEKGTGHGLHAGEVELNTTRRADGTYALVDTERGGNTVRDALNDYYYSGIGKYAEFSDSDNAWGDGTRADRATAAVDALYGMAQTWDYLKDTFGRRGIGDDGKGVTAYVHHSTDQANAAWFGTSCACMTFGDGRATGAPFTALDVVAHEMAHGLTDHTANLVYRGESGALNEATSDIFGTLVEFYANNPVDPPDYLAGEQTRTREPALRRMDEPSLDGKSVSCWTPTAKDLDVHHSSGIGNKFFYNLAVGSGTSPWGQSTPCGDAGPVTGIGNDKAAQIWYRALTLYMVSNTDYAGARVGTLLAATDLHGQDSVEWSAVDAAWRAVGVDGSQPGWGTPEFGPIPDSVPTPRAGETVSYQLTARDPQRQEVAFSATGLPPGVSITPAGLISGAPTTRGEYRSSVTATDPDGNSTESSMRWVVKGPPLVDSAPADMIMQMGAITTVGIYHVTFTDAPDWQVDPTNSFKASVTGAPDGFNARIRSQAQGTFIAEVSGVVRTPGSGTAVVTGTDADGDQVTVSIPWEVRPAKTPSAPIGVQVTGGNGTALVTWDRPTPGIGKLLPEGYVVRVSPGAETRVGEDARSLTLTGLDPRRAYTIGVRATSKSGDGPEQTITLAPTGLPLSASPAAITYGQASTVSGRVLRDNTTPVAGATVIVEHRPAGKTTWSRFATVRTDSKGVWRATAKSATTSAIRARYIGSAGLWPATSANTWISVRYTVTAKASTTKPKANKKIKISGTAKPARGGVQVTLQYKKGTRWITITSTRTTATGAYTFSRAFKRGTWTLRTVISGGSYNATGTSTSVKIKVT